MLKTNKHYYAKNNNNKKNNGNIFLGEYGEAGIVCIRTTKIKKSRAKDGKKSLNA